MKIKVGEYVRLKYWGISKCIKIENGLYTFDKLDDECWSGDLPNVIYECELEDMVEKHSFNIMDLIEIGDYVNGYKIKEIYVDGNGKNLWFRSNVKSNDYWQVNKKIKSIVTKEQFKAMEYEEE